MLQNHFLQNFTDFPTLYYFSNQASAILDMHTILMHDVIKLLKRVINAHFVQNLLLNTGEFGRGCSGSLALEI